MGKCLIIAFLLLAESVVAQVYCVRAIGHTPEHERIFFQKGDPMAAARLVADLGPAPVYPEIAAIGKLFANAAGERTNHFYQSCLPEVPVLDTRLQCPGNLLSLSDVFALLSGTFAVPRAVWTN